MNPFTSMKLRFKTLRAGLVLAAFIPFATGALLADAAAPQAPTKAPETPVHEIGAAPTAAPAPAAATAPTPDSAPAAATEKEWRSSRNDDNKVTVGDATYVARGENVFGNAVAVMGPTTVDGSVDGNAVAVMGRTTINGTVRGNAVAVLGNLTLGPKSHVDGNAVGRA